jgi:hypothetical protein
LGLSSSGGGDAVHESAGRFAQHETLDTALLVGEGIDNLEAMLDSPGVRAIDWTAIAPSPTLGSHRGQDLGLIAHFPSARQPTLEFKQR